MYTVLSLFDHSGIWAEPFTVGGNQVILWNIKQGMDVFALDSAETCLDLLDIVDGILAAIPCTDFASSGAQYWRMKDLNGQTEMSMELVRQTLRIVNLFRPSDPDYDGVFFWAIENPAGRLNTLFPSLPKPVYFHAYEFAGYLDLTAPDHNELERITRKDGIGISQDEFEFVIRCNAYKKRTGLWGEFNSNLCKKPVEPVRLSRQGTFTQRFGGKTERTKEVLSTTPLRFSRAFYQANKNFSYSDLESTQLELFTI